MTDSKFVCNARFVGRSAVDGPLNDYRLSDVVSTLQEESRAKKSQVRRHVEIQDILSLILKT